MAGPPASPAELTAEERELGEFASVVLADTEDTWRVLFEQMGEVYLEPTLVLYSGAVQSACGFARSAAGPFYCSADQKVYLDLRLFVDLRRPTPDGSPGPCRSGRLHARQLGAAHALVPAGVRDRGCPAGEYLRGEGAVGGATLANCVRVGFVGQCAVVLQRS